VSLSRERSSFLPHGQSALSLRLSLSDLPSVSASLFRSLSGSRLFPSHIDEFIAGTARAIVTKIVYDIDSSFYVNPVSEWFWSTWRESEHAFCIRTDAHTPERECRQQCRANVCDSASCMSRGEENGGSGGQRQRGELSTNLRGNGRTPKVTVRSAALCHRYANWAQLA